MNIGGLQKVSLIDYPEKICAVLFVQGCNFRCPFCHNPELVDPALYHDCIPEEEIFSFLEKRKGILDAVSISGGEPTTHPGLFDFIERVKGMGYLVKIDTNGSLPEVLEKLIDRGLLDYIAMDVKAPLMRYREITGSDIKPARIKQSIKMIMDSGIEYEFRTTVVKSLLNKNDLRKIAVTIKDAKRYVLQKFVPSKSLDEKFLSEATYSDEDLEDMKEKLKKYVGHVTVR
jgi:pyruvate formate lyase activating enzyme